MIRKGFSKIIATIIVINSKKIKQIIKQYSKTYSKRRASPKIPPVFKFIKPLSMQKKKLLARE